MAEARNIRYSNKDFASLRQQLINHAKTYFPDTYNDFSPASPGMMFMEQAAYVGDLMSFYQDMQVQETFLQYAQEKQSLYNLAYMMGYTPKTVALSSVELDIFQRVPAKGAVGNQEPDLDYALVLGSDFVVKSSDRSAVKFYTNKVVDFSINTFDDPTEVSVYSSTDGTINEFLLRKRVKAFAGDIATKTFSLGNPEKFLTLTLRKESLEIAGILNVTDSDGNVWTEVPYLAQDTIFSERKNTGPDASIVPYLLELKQVPNRFVTRYDTDGNLLLQFGSGLSTNSSALLPNPEKIGPASYFGSSSLDTAYDPSNALVNDSYGVAPHNTTLTIQYLQGVGIAGNVPSNTITQILSGTTSFVTPVTDVNNYFRNSLAVTNASPAQGGRDGDTPDEIRQNAMAAFYAQKRAVTPTDFSTRVLSLPAKFGSVAKEFATQEQLRSTNATSDVIIDSNPLAISVYVLSYDSEGKLTTTSPSLKSNIKTYLSQYKMLSDALNIRDAFVVNIGVSYEIVVLPEYNAREVLLRANLAVKDFFNINRWNINQPIELSRLATAVDRVKGVQSIENISITNKVGGIYSNTAYDINAAKRRNIIYPSYDPMIFEVKYPDIDIVGRITTY